ncbi:hypothetical protein EJ08DRAFT_729322 [Tothia fuscella]|uniref:Uncharacterized protein n=1 Tax=Tothia fuscella TaxID=1048955 RepID=A0A9P4P0U0_9PEZI|nr:hypothetical protein EJ08DRAFT_729322 [Tothia fuscella]
METITEVTTTTNTPTVRVPPRRRVDTPLPLPSAPIAIPARTKPKVDNPFPSHRPEVAQNFCLSVKQAPKYAIDPRGPPFKYPEQPKNCACCTCKEFWREKPLWMVKITDPKARYIGRKRTPREAKALEYCRKCILAEGGKIVKDAPDTLYTILWTVPDGVKDLSFELIDPIFRGLQLHTAVYDTEGSLAAIRWTNKKSSKSDEEERATRELEDLLRMQQRRRRRM